jgi:putative copper export protein
MPGEVMPPKGRTRRGWAIRGATAALTPALLICLLACPALAQDGTDALPDGGILLGLVTTFIRSIAYVCLFAAAGGGLFLLGIVRGDLHLARRLQPGLLFLCAAAGIAAALDVGLEGALAEGDLASLFGPSAWVSGLAGARGLGASILLVALGILSFGISAHRQRGAAMAVLAGAIGAAVALAVGSDAAAEPPGWLSFGAVALHVLTAMILAGAVWPLVVTLTTQSAGDSLRLARRFAGPSLAAFALLAASGLALSPAGLVDPDTAFTNYGVVWYGKLLLVLLLLAVCLRQRRKLVPVLATDVPGTGFALRRSILVEGALYAAAVLATVLLQLTQTPLFPLEQP